MHGHPDLELREIWGVLPIGRLAAADAVLALATLVGLALFVIPGIIVFTLWSLVGPVITIEDRLVGSAFRRSWQLVRPCFWLTLWLVTVPLQVEQAVLHAIEYTDDLRASARSRLLAQRAARDGDRLGRRARRSGVGLRARSPVRPLRRTGPTAPDARHVRLSGPIAGESHAVRLRLRRDEIAAPSDSGTARG